MPRYKILKEEPVPEIEQTPGDASSRSRFADTGEIFEGEPAAVQPELERLQLANGGSFAAEAID